MPPDNFDYENFELTISADKGIENADKAGVKPDVLVGDFDSSSAKGAKEVIRYPAEKDVTDTEIAVDYAISKGAEEIMIFGGTGGRADHSMANIMLLARTAKKGIDIKMLDGTNLFFVTLKSLEVKKQGFKYMSLFPLFGDVENLTLSGVKYPLDSYLLKCDSSLCVSNEIEMDKAVITFSAGALLIVLSEPDTNLG